MEKMEEVKKYKNGLVLGKFYPPTSGHKYLIDTAIDNCEKTYVFICYTNNDEITGEQRYEAIKYEYSNNPNVFIYNLNTSKLPQYESECETLDKFYEYWVKLVYDNVKELDVVFTSETYGDDFARYLNIEHKLVDIERKTYPTSGSKQRENPDFNLLPDSSKKCLTKRFCFVGPESSGKTISSKMISDYYKCPFVEEYGRRYVEEIGLNKKTREDNFNIIDINNIAANQLHLEDEATKISEGMIVCDTDIMVTQIFSEIYFNEAPRWIIEESWKRSKDYIYFLMDIDFDWVDDGTREFPEKRKWHFNRIKQELERRNCEYYLISGSIEERFDKCKDIIYEKI
jgi:HTH-type transcriptional regulator, transcriptional repressor of NAD biosynthesis genes